MNAPLLAATLENDPVDYLPVLALLLLAVGLAVVQLFLS